MRYLIAALALAVFAPATFACDRPLVRLVAAERAVLRVPLRAASVSLRVVSRTRVVVRQYVAAPVVVVRQFVPYPAPVGK